MKFLYLAISLFIIACNAPNPEQGIAQVVPLQNKHVGGACEDCELMFAGISNKILPVDTSIAWKEGGRRLCISGTIFKKDAVTPAAGVTLYYYHTDSNGYYSQGIVHETATKHGYIRGWVKTTSDGHYKIYTRVPAPYPNATIPSHIHCIIKEPGLNEYYIDEFVFDDDPLLTDKERKQHEGRGGSGILHTKNANGILKAERNIILGLNIPGYPDNR